AGVEIHVVRALSIAGRAAQGGGHAERPELEGGAAGHRGRAIERVGETGAESDEGQERKRLLYPDRDVRRPAAHELTLPLGGLVCGAELRQPEIDARAEADHPREVRLGEEIREQAVGLERRGAGVEGPRLEPIVDVLRTEVRELAPRELVSAKLELLAPRHL